MSPYTKTTPPLKRIIIFVIMKKSQKLDRKCHIFHENLAIVTFSTALKKRVFICEIVKKIEMLDFVGRRAWAPKTKTTKSYFRHK